MSSADDICKQFRPMSSLTWIRSAWHSEGIPEKICWEKTDDKTNKKTKHAKALYDERWTILQLFIIITHIKPNVIISV